MIEIGLELILKFIKKNIFISLFNAKWPIFFTNLWNSLPYTRGGLGGEREHQITRDKLWEPLLQQTDKYIHNFFITKD